MLHSFMGAGLEVGPGVLVPRAETELLGRTVIALIASNPTPTIIDMCTGSGNLALAVAHGHPGATVYGGDISEAPIQCARQNAARLGLADRTQFEQGDMFGALDAYGLAGRTDVVMANPPYISSHKLDGESAHLLDSEPREAFDAGPYGISFHQQLIAGAKAYLTTGGWLAMEFGLGQERQMRALFTRAGGYADITFHNDADGNPRVVAARKL